MAAASESPFDQYKHVTTTMFLEPILNTHYKIYQTVITFSDFPDGPIRPMVKPINTRKLSPFQSLPVSAIFSDTCTKVLCRYPGFSGSRNPNYYMGGEDIPAVFSYLSANGYTIDSDLTKMMNKSRVTIGGQSFRGGDKRMICMITYSA